MVNTLLDLNKVNCRHKPELEIKKEKKKTELRHPSHLVNFVMVKKLIKAAVQITQQLDYLPPGYHDKMRAEQRLSLDRSEQEQKRNGHRISTPTHGKIYTSLKNVGPKAFRSQFFLFVK